MLSYREGEIPPSFLTEREGYLQHSLTRGVDSQPPSLARVGVSPAFVIGNSLFRALANQRQDVFEKPCFLRGKSTFPALYTERGQSLQPFLPRGRSFSNTPHREGSSVSDRPCEEGRVSLALIVKWE
jgi:hypothetical protein